MKRIHCAQRLKIIFVVVIILSFVLWSINIAIYRESSDQLSVFFARMNDFLADYTNTTGYSAYRSPYDNTAYVGFQHKQYPPLAYVLFWIVSRFSTQMETYYANDYFLNMYHEPLFLFMMMLFYIGCGIAIFELVKANLKGSRGLRTMVATAAMLSFPVLYTIERGNNIILVSILTMVYLFYYESEHRIAREIALVSLALASALKLTPAVLAILLVYRKRWADAVKVVIYALLLGILPFLFFDGGLPKQFPLWIRNLQLSAQAYSPFDGISISGVFGFFYPGDIGIETVLGRAVLIINYVICGLLLWFSAYYVHRWEKALALTLVMVSISGQSGRYGLLYFLPFMVMFLNVKSHTYTDLFVYLGILLIMCPYKTGLWERGMNYRAAIPVFCTVLLIRGAARIKAGRSTSALPKVTRIPGYRQSGVQ